MLSAVDPEYARRATPPQRFVDALESEAYVICLKPSCGLPMVVDPLAFSQTRATVIEWRRNNDKPVPLRFLKMFMRCLNGHTESWCAEPKLSLDVIEEAAPVGETYDRTCGRCGEQFKGWKRSRFCSECRSDS